MNPDVHGLAAGGVLVNEGNFHWAPPDPVGRLHRYQEEDARHRETGSAAYLIANPPSPLDLAKTAVLLHQANVRDAQARLLTAHHDLCNACREQANSPEPGRWMVNAALAQIGREADALLAVERARADGQRVLDAVRGMAA